MAAKVTCGVIAKPSEAVTTAAKPITSLRVREVKERVGVFIDAPPRGNFAQL